MYRAGPEGQAAPVRRGAHGSARGQVTRVGSLRGSEVSGSEEGGRAGREVKLDSDKGKRGKSAGLPLEHANTCEIRKAYHL